MRYALILLLIAGCSGSESSPTGPDGPVQMTEVYKDQSTGVLGRRAEVISRESRWVEVWSEIVSNRSPKPALPAVNFDEKILVLAALGDTGDACKSVRIETVTRVAGALNISIAETRPPANCSCPPVTVQPVHVVAIPRAATDASFNWRTLTLGGCTP
jgi:hypothetical protein